MVSQPAARLNREALGIKESRKLRPRRTASRDSGGKGARVCGGGGTAVQCSPLGDERHAHHCSRHRRTAWDSRRVRSFAPWPVSVRRGPLECVHEVVEDRAMARARSRCCVMASDRLHGVPLRRHKRQSGPRCWHSLHGRVLRRAGSRLRWDADDGGGPGQRRLLVPGPASCRRGDRHCSRTARTRTCDCQLTSSASRMIGRCVSRPPLNTPPWNPPVIPISAGGRSPLKCWLVGPWHAPERIPFVFAPAEACQAGRHCRGHNRSSRAGIPVRRSPRPGRARISRHGLARSSPLDWRDARRIPHDFTVALVLRSGASDQFQQAPFRTTEVTLPRAGHGCLVWAASTDHSDFGTRSRL